VAAAPGDDEVLVWALHAGAEAPRFVKPQPARQKHKRHTKKYAEGDLGEDRSFYFRGPRNALKLRAQNLRLFLQIADGVDDETWEHHRRAGDYSRWFRDYIKDAGLADEAARIEADRSLDAGQSRKLIDEAVTKRYTAPATAASDH
jgi:hypothetical protein